MRVRGAEGSGASSAPSPLLSLGRIKTIFGEFPAVNGPSANIGIDQAWVDANTEMASIHRLGTLGATRGSFRRLRRPFRRSRTRAWANSSARETSADVLASVHQLGQGGRPVPPRMGDRLRLQRLKQPLRASSDDGSPAWWRSWNATASAGAVAGTTRTECTSSTLPIPNLSPAISTKSRHGLQTLTCRTFLHWSHGFSNDRSYRR